MTLAKTRDALRAQIAKMTAEYLANGGQITLCPTGKRALGAKKDEKEVN
jgi:hypothetical protein